MYKPLISYFTTFYSCFQSNDEVVMAASYSEVVIYARDSHITGASDWSAPPDAGLSLEELHRVRVSVPVTAWVLGELTLMAAAGDGSIAVWDFSGLGLVNNRVKGSIIIR